MNEDNVFQLTDLTLSYGQKPVVQEVTLGIPAGCTTALIGANGSGKSTLLKGLSRQLPPTRGSIECEGRALSQWRPRTFAQRVALLPQSPVTPEGLTVSELVSRGRFPHQPWWGSTSAQDDAAVSAALDAVDLEPIADKPVDAISGGQLQRAWIALVLAQQTPTILLDEPTAALDLAHQVDLLATLEKIRRERQERTTVVAVLHELNLAAAFADWVVVLKQGRVVATGSPQEIFRPALLEDVFNLEAEVIDDPTAGHPVVLPRGRVRAAQCAAPLRQALAVA